MNNRRISIVFCGGCNPRINRGQVALQVRDILAARGYEVLYNSVDVDFIIYMSGCTANCALHSSHSKHPSVVVAATTLDAETIEKEDLANKIVMKVRDYFE